MHAPFRSLVAAACLWAIGPAASAAVPTLRIEVASAVDPRTGDPTFVTTQSWEGVIDFGRITHGEEPPTGSRFEAPGGAWYVSTFALEVDAVAARGDRDAARVMERRDGSGSSTSVASGRRRARGGLGAWLGYADLSAWLAEPPLDGVSVWLAPSTSGTWGAEPAVGAGQLGVVASEVASGVELRRRQTWQIAVYVPATYTGPLRTHVRFAARPW